MDNILLRVYGLVKMKDILDKDRYIDLVKNILKDQSDFYSWLKDTSLKYFVEISEDIYLDKIKLIVSKRNNLYKIKEILPVYKNYSIIIYEK